MRNSFKSGWLILALIACSGMLAGATLLFGQIPDIPEQLQQHDGGIIVSITKPANASEWPVGTPLPISASILNSNPVESLELWADGRLVEKKDTASGRAFWTWVIISPGEHTLIVRAVAKNGFTATSNIVHILATKDANPGMVLIYTTGQGDTLAGLSEKFNVPSQEISDLNPPLTSDSPLTENQPLKIPISYPGQGEPPDKPGSPPLPNGPTQNPSNPPNKFVFWVGNLINQNPPAAPLLALTVSGCSLNALITDQSSNENGFNLYRLDPGEQIFKLISTLGPSNNKALPIQYTDPNLYGSFEYYVSSFNGEGESPSNIASVDETQQNCQTPFWVGSQLKIPLLLPPVQGQDPNFQPTFYDKAYFYYSTNDNSWGRVPQDPSQFLSLPGGLFNPDDQINGLVEPPAQGTLTIHIDAWGWTGGALMHIGTFKRTLTAPSAGGSQPANEAPSLLQICDANVCGGDVGGTFGEHAVNGIYQNWPLRWQPGQENATQGLVQVSVVPFQDTCNVNSGGVIWTQNQAVNGTAFNYFSINFGPLKGKSAFVNGWNVSGNTFYIRVLPLANNQTICQPSNSVSYEVKTYMADTPSPTLMPVPAAPAPPAAFDAKIIKFTPIQFPDFHYQYCVVVTANPFYNNPQAVADYIANTFDTNAAVWAGFKVGDTLCPKPYSYAPPDESFWDEVGNWVKSAINFVANAYNDLKGFVVDLAANLNPLCIQAKLGASAAGSGGNTVDEVCHKIAEATVDIGLAYVGLPPSLPNYDEFSAVSKGYVADLAVEQLGSDCPDPEACKKIIETGYDQMTAELHQSQDNSSCVDEGTAHANGFEPFCEPAGAVTKPAPQGQLIPALVTVQLTRKADVPDSAFPDPSMFATQCGFNIHVSAKNDSLVGQQIFIGVDTKTGKNPVYWNGTEISGKIFKDVGTKIPKMNPGNTVTLSLALTPSSADYDSFANPTVSSNDGFWLPGHLELAKEWGWIEQTKVLESDDWRYLYFGSTATVGLIGNCTASASGYKSNSSSFTDTFTWIMPSAQP